MLDDGGFFFSSARVETHPKRPVLIPLPSPRTREDLSRFSLLSLEENIPFIPLLSFHFSIEHLQSLHPTPKARMKGETLFVKAPVSLGVHSHTLTHTHTSYRPSVTILLLPQPNSHFKEEL